MKTINVIYVNHLDLTWRRPRYSITDYDGYSIRSYSQLQERMLDRGLQFAREGGVYEIEQTTTLREYIENNPDMENEVSDMISDGRLRILGGGEAVIDYNMPDGESVIRNHLYSVRYLNEKFGVKPEFAACPDTFGLSAGLPQLFRQLGYTGISMYHRVFPDNKPCWNGIDNSIVALETAKAYPGTVMFVGTFKKCRVCPVCGGEGCPACDGRGYIELLCPDSAVDKSRLRNAILNSKDDVITIYISGEESAVADDFIGMLRNIAADGEYKLNFTGTEALIKEKYSKLIERVKSNKITDEEIDPRAEGGPVASGCYTTRIKLKLENRRCESALRCAERLCVMAAKNNAVYPSKAFEKLWRKLAFIHFHDAIPASHSDAAYDELMKIARELRIKADRLAFNAARHILGNEHGNGKTFAIFNPLEFEVKNVPLTGVGNIPRGCEKSYVLCPDGSRAPIFSIHRSSDPSSEEATFEFYGSLPALGYSSFSIGTGDPISEASKCIMSNVMENEFLRVTFNNHGISEIYDKQVCRAISLEGSFAPVIEEDCGNPWSRTSIKAYRDRADAPTFPESMIPRREAEPQVLLSYENGIQTAIIHINFSLNERQIKNLDWTLTATLVDGSDSLGIKIDTAFNARDMRIMTMLPLAFAPADGKILYEIPLGNLSRGSVEVFDAQLGYSDDYAALRYVRATDGELAVTLCNSGTPAHRIDGRTIYVSLLRNPTQLCCGFDTDGASDASLNTFRFTLSTSSEHTGAILESYRRGMALNTYFPTFKASSGTDIKSLIHLPDNAMLSALKGAESGNGIICRYIECDGKDTTLHFKDKVTESDILEYVTTGDRKNEFKLKPYEIKTFIL